jgi:uncharacterized protein (DUF924 family)
VQLGSSAFHPDFSAVLDFWFGAPDSPLRGRSRPAWFRKSAEFDAEIRTRFAATWEAASLGGLSRWEETPLAGVALVVVLDQFPRNMFRGTPKAFASDPPALAAARRFIERGFDRILRPTERLFVYLPFEHAEDLASQEAALELFEELERNDPGSDLLSFARRHHDIIARFGRFPHRNAILDRVSTPEEREFLQQPGSRF